MEVPNADLQLTLSSSCGFLKAVQGYLIKSVVKGDASALMSSLWTVEMEPERENSFHVKQLQRVLMPWLLLIKMQLVVSFKW